jgi:putative sterol carrier protein
MAGFMTGAWAQDIREAFNAWPGDERKASKLQDFWDWIDMIRPFVTGRLALNVRDLPPDAGADGADGDTLVLDFDGGAVAAASVTSRAEAEADAVFLLSGSYADWQDMLAGYDVGKVVMYRKLMLEKGDTLQFFMAAFYWTELLACIQSVPVQTLQRA